ncbi:MAG: alpha/beta hydrolase [Candidatus Binatia bacterium]
MEREQRVSFSNNRGETLIGILHQPAGSQTPLAAILCHGMESSKETEKLISLSRTLARRGFLVLRFDFAYAGESSGKFEEITYSSEVDDLKAAFNFLLGYHVSKISILGSSMGGTVALLFAAQETRVAALVTVAAPFHPEKITERLLTSEELKQWQQVGFTTYHGRRINISLFEDLKRLDLTETAKKITCPVSIIHGDTDETVPVTDAYDLYHQLGGPKQIHILPGSDHRFSNGSQLDGALRESIDWIAHYLQ